jgi:anhydro-N-acetylmuramic acid kinase
MVYRVIGLMSGSSLDGLDIAFAQFQNTGGKWSYKILESDCMAYPSDWVERLRSAVHLDARRYQLLHAAYGHYLGAQVNQFINKYQLEYQVQLIASHGHTSFHMPELHMTAQLGDGAAIAAETGLPVVSDLRSLDLALGGQGAPIVPIGEKLIWSNYDYFLNLGGIANISCHQKSAKGDVTTGAGDGTIVAFDVCPANRVMNLLATEVGKEYDESGNLASAGSLVEALLERLNHLEYYDLPFPKSLANEFGTEVVFPLLHDAGCKIEDALRTYVEHISVQVRKAIEQVRGKMKMDSGPGKMLVTGGGAYNIFLVERLRSLLRDLNIEVLVAEDELIQYKEAVVMALMGVLRWREENNVLSSVTGARRDSIGGAIWMGLEA